MGIRGEASPILPVCPTYDHKVVFDDLLVHLVHDAHDKLPGHTHMMLEEQHRMHPDIASIASHLFHDGKLTNGGAVADHPNAFLFLY